VPRNRIGPAAVRLRRGCLAPVTLVACAAATPGAAQDSLQEQLSAPAIQLDHTSTGFRSGSLIAAPIPIQDPTIGTGLALGAGYLFSVDEGSDPSTLALGGFRTNNGSEGVALGGSLNFGNGDWTIRAGAAFADLVYDVYILGQPIGINQSGAFVRLGAGYQVTEVFGIDLDLQYLQSEIALDPVHLVGDTILGTGLDVEALTADLTFGYDTRDDTIYPTSGTQASLRLGWGEVQDNTFDLDRDFARSLAAISHYVPVFEQGVIAGQVTACAVDDATPFFLACLLGASDSFRGYPATQHIGDALTSLQVEYRGRFGASRFGYVAFAGLGAVASDLSDLGDADTLVAGGVGLRYRVSRQFPVDFSFDVALNEQDEVTTYLYIGQRF
jgi:outer membrane protein assembly factor BamA